MYDLISFLVFLAFGFVFGQLAEKKHYKSIYAREKQYKKIIAINSRFPPQDGTVRAGQLVTGSVVVSVDYFKRFLAGLRSLLGGRITSYETLLDRARREAILRMKEEADKMGADMVFNTKLTTSSISKNTKGKIGSVEVLAYGTALVPVK